MTATLPTTLFDELYPPDPADLPDDSDDSPRRENTLGQAARDTLVTRMIGRCRAEAVTFANAIRRPNEIQDFESVALLACVNAARFYEESHGTKYETYATSWIRRSFRREAAKIELANEIESWDTITDRGTRAGDEGGDVDEGHGDREAGDRQPNGEQRVLLSKLSPTIREVVRLCVFECLTPDTIAERLAMPLKDVKLAIRNAGETIAKFMKFDDAPHLFSDKFEDAWPGDDHAI